MIGVGSIGPGSLPWRRPYARYTSLLLTTTTGRNAGRTTSTTLRASDSDIAAMSSTTSAAIRREGDCVITDAIALAVQMGDAGLWRYFSFAAVEDGDLVSDSRQFVDHERTYASGTTG